MMSEFLIQPLAEKHRAWVVNLLIKHWGSTVVVSRGHVHQADKLPGFVALMTDKLAGLITYNIADGQCEIVTLNSLVERDGAGSSLVDHVVSIARLAKCQRLWLVTTNDNLMAVRFYQKRGFHIAHVYPDVIKEWRKIKPEIPLVGLDGIPIRDEIEMEMIL